MKLSEMRNRGESMMKLAKVSNPNDDKAVAYIQGAALVSSALWQIGAEICYRLEASTKDVES